MEPIACPNCNNILAENETVCENCGWDLIEADAENKAPPKVISGETMTKEDLEAFSKGETVLEFASEKPEPKEIEKKKSDSKQNKDHKSIKDIKADVRNFIKNGIGETDSAAAPINMGIFSFQNIDSPDSPDSSNTANTTSAPFSPSDGGLLDLSIFDEIAEKEEKKQRRKLKIKPPKFLVKIGSLKIWKVITSFVVRLGIMILSAAVAFLLGFFISDFYHSNLYIDRTYDLAMNSVNAILPKIPAGSEMYLQEIYIKPGKEIAECIIFASVKTSVGDYYNTNYRLVIDVKNPAETTLYYAFDAERYEILKNGTPQEAVTASVMMSHYDSFKRSLAEIAEGKNGWSEANAAYINLLLSENRK